MKATLPQLKISSNLTRRSPQDEEAVALTHRIFNRKWSQVPSAVIFQPLFLVELLFLFFYCYLYFFPRFVWCWTCNRGKTISYWAYISQTVKCICKTGKCRGRSLLINIIKTHISYNFEDDTKHQIKITLKVRQLYIV